MVTENQLQEQKQKKQTGYQKPKQTSFANFNQRDYDFNKLTEQFVNQPMQRVDDDPLLKAEAEELRKKLLFQKPKGSIIQ